MKNYKKLRIWKNGIKVVKKTYEISRKLPVSERYGMISQMTRAAVSIPANIAEGSSRRSDKDYARFLEMALGSAFELETYFEITKEMNWITEESLQETEIVLEEEIKMIQAFIKLLRKNK